MPTDQELTMSHRASIFFLLAALTLTACGGDDVEDGTLEIRIYGEEFAEDGIPADVFGDGWEMRFDKVLISVGEAHAATADDDPALSAAAYQVFDLAQASDGEGYLVASGEVPGGAYDVVGFRVAADGDAVAGNAEADDVELMIDGELALYVEGNATKDDVTKSFAWGFTGATRYDACEGTAEIDGTSAATVLTIHMDHLFYDDLFSEEPNVAFDLVAAADTDDDDEVTADELAALDISTEERYQVGSTGIDNLFDFIAYQTGTVGHIDGEGHCGTAERE
jgi:hypothetical protein